MSKFFSSYNNGTTAVISEFHAQIFANLVEKARLAEKGGKQTEWPKVYELALELGVRVFTFCSKERIERNPSDKHIFTGTYEDLEQLIKLGNHELQSSCGSGWTGYVPFSNFYESGIHGKDIQEQELRYRTTLRDVIDSFGIQSVMTKAA